MNKASLDSLSDQVLALIRRRRSTGYTIDKLVEKFRCDKSDIVFAVGLLKQAGYEIRTDSKDKYRLISAPDLLLSAEITHALKTTQIGQNVYAYKAVQSTNTLAAHLADVKAPEGSLVVAESQTRGRGRLGRSWHSPEGTGIYLSIILYPDIDPASAPGLSIMTAISLAETISRYKPGTTHVKWPNDCLVNGRKVAGILTELSADVGKVNHVIVGVGINVNQRRKDFPGEISKKATSLRLELKKQIHRVDLLKLFLVNFEKDYYRFKKSGLPGLRKKIIKYSNLLGKKIRLDMSGRIITGKAIDIDKNGCLVLDTPEGRQSFNAGEVTVLTD